jgi:thioredoxin reductase (NADPH)
MDRAWDCLVIGGGPAGLTSALYLARFRRKVLVIDAGNSRAAAIPRTHNHPGFIEGISGAALLDALRTQAQNYGGQITCGTVQSVERHNAGFVAKTTLGEVTASRLIVATGIKDICPAVEGSDPVAIREAVRFCPVCDGFEAVDRKIAVYGPSQHAVEKARFLRVPPEMLAEETAVSANVAAAMARGAAVKARASLAVAVTGVTGAEPDEDGNPVGLVFCAAARADGGVKTLQLRLGEQPPHELVEQACEAALSLLRDFAFA